MSNTQETAAVVPFVSQEVRDAFAEGVSGAFGKLEKAKRSLVATLLTSARSLERVVTEEDWDAHLAKAARKAISAKVSKDSVKVYLSQAKRATIAATGRPSLDDLPLGKHWADQRTGGRKLEGVTAYDKRITALLKLATRNEQGHLILPEGYSLMGELTTSPVADDAKADDAKADAPASAATVADAEGGLNVDPTEAKDTTRENAATVLMGNAKAAAALLALLADDTGKAALATLLRDHAKAMRDAKAKADADAKAGEAAAAFAAGMNKAA